jgi:hypothetical protein
VSLRKCTQTCAYTHTYTHTHTFIPTQSHTGTHTTHIQSQTNHIYACKRTAEGTYVAHHLQTRRSEKERKKCQSVFVDSAVSTPALSKYLGLARTIYIRCIYGVFGREITKYTVVYGVYIRFWPTLYILLKGTPQVSAKLISKGTSYHTMRSNTLTIQ